MTGRWVRALAGIAAVVLLAAGCDSSTSRADDPVDPIAVATVPTRPFMPTRLPDGWAITSRSTTPEAVATHRSMDQMSQFLYLPPGGSASSGPAVLVGYIVDDQSAPVSSAGDGGARRRRVREGVKVSETSGPDDVTANAAYVIGRDVDDDTIDRALQSFRWDRPRALEPGQGLRLHAASRLPASGLPALAMLHVGPDDTTRWVSIIQEDGNAAEQDVARFWESIDPREPCGTARQHTTFRGQTIIRFLAGDTATLRLASDVIEPGLQRVPLTDFEAG